MILLYVGTKYEGRVTKGLEYSGCVWVFWPDLTPALQKRNQLNIDRYCKSTSFKNTLKSSASESAENNCYQTNLLNLL